MIISKTPYRISIAGGSADYKSHYSKHGAFLIGFAFDKYCYVSLNQTEHLTDVDFQAYYSEVEKVVDINKIKNPGVRGPLQYINETDRLENLAIYIQNELPSKTGIGSSSSLSVGLLNCLRRYKRYKANKKSLAIDSIYVERELNKEAGGIQDNIFASYGGLQSITIEKDGHFLVRPVPVSEDFLTEFKNSCLLFYTNSQRDSYELAESHNNPAAESHKIEITNLAKEMYEYFVMENVPLIGSTLNKLWYHKKKISDLISNPKVDEAYDKIMKSGAFGAKLLGSGSSGFFFTMFPKQNRKKIIDAVQMPYLDVNIDKDGSKIVFEECYG